MTVAASLQLQGRQLRGRDGQGRQEPSQGPDCEQSHGGWDHGGVPWAWRKLSNEIIFSVRQPSAQWQPESQTSSRDLSIIIRVVL